MRKEEKDNLKLMLQALIVGLIAGAVVGLFRFGIEKTSAFWLYLFKEAHNNPVWFVAIVLGLAAVGIIAGYFVKQYPLEDPVFQKLNYSFKVSSNLNGGRFCGES